MATKTAVKTALHQHADPEKAAFYPRFFKCGQGEYGEGDRFLGVTVPRQRKVAKRFKDVNHKVIRQLLDDRHHECRLTALLILVGQYQRADSERRQEIFDLYVAKLDRVNNWDLVDASAAKIVGRHLESKDRSLLDDWAATDDVWKQRIAIIATYHFIRHDDFADTLRIAEKLLHHDHDLIHKAVGWMLREVGKRDLGVLEKFLHGHYRSMPRTMLRYAIERLPDKRRKQYLRGEV